MVEQVHTDQYLGCRTPFAEVDKHAQYQNGPVRNITLPTQGQPGSQVFLHCCIFACQLRQLASYSITAVAWISIV